VALMMTDDSAHGRAWAALFSRLILGFIFFMAGVFKVFQMGPLTHATNLFVEPYADTFLPVWSLWLTGTTIPVVELIAGALLLVGWRTRDALVALGIVLVLVTFGHLIPEPLFPFDRHVIPRWALLTVCFLLRDDDAISIDGWLRHRRASLPPAA
jgi:thiosulfate dehydrogenase [quinone] large subunit